MGSTFTELTEKHKNFIARQKVYFVATASKDSKINLSPKGMDSLRVIDSITVAWLNLTGSGNETAAHVQLDGRMTIMFCAFEEPPLILRLYGQARAIHQKDPEWEKMTALFPTIPGTRQIFILHIQMLQSSCGMGVPLFEYQQNRDALQKWATNKGTEKIQQYWQLKNSQSLDGIPTHIMEKNL